MNPQKQKMQTSISQIRPGHTLGGLWAGGLLGMALAATFVSSGCSKGDVAEAAPTVTVQVGAAENQTIERKVIAEATLYPLEQAAIVPKINAPVKKFYAEKGSKVHAGQLLAKSTKRSTTLARTCSPPRWKTKEHTPRRKRVMSKQFRKPKATSSCPRRLWTPLRNSMTRDRAFINKEQRPPRMSTTPTWP